MNLFTIDESLCKRDGACAAECPAKIITAPDKNNFPMPTDKAAELCIRCGHCVAVCPHGAFAHSTVKKGDCTEIIDSLRINPDQAGQFLKSRRSVRTYREKPLGREVLEKLIDTARYAPSGHNTQPVEWKVVYDRKDVHAYAGMTVDWMRYMHREQPQAMAMLHLDRFIDAWEQGFDRVCRNAPHLIIAHGHGKNPMAPAACTIALAHLDLAAWGMGLGACWAGLLSNAAANWEPLAKELKFPEGHRCMGALMLGEPAYRYRLIPSRKKPKISWQ